MIHLNRASPDDANSKLFRMFTPNVFFMFTLDLATADE